jgi:hypothetical protein
MGPGIYFIFKFLQNGAFGKKIAKLVYSTWNF